MAYWIFQSSPEFYQLTEGLAELGDDDWTWEVNQHKTEVHPGDEVVVWKSGQDAGIYALARVMSEPSVTTDKLDPYWSDKQRGDAPRLRVKLHITQRFLDRPLLRSNLLDDASLEKLSILRFGRGTNFPVTQSEWGILLQLLGGETNGGALPDALPIAETHLRSALAKNLSQIEPGLLPYFDERVEEYPIPHGYIDLLCKDEGGTPVVVEIKRIQWSADKAVGQIASYMGWAKTNLAEGGEVHGILLVDEASSKNARLLNAIAAIPGLTIKEYLVSFSIK